MNRIEGRTESDWRMLAREMNARPPLNKSRIVFVSMDCQGLSYPKFYTRIDTGLPEDTDFDGLMGTLEKGGEAEVAWHGNVTGVIQLVGPDWHGGRPLEFATGMLDCLLETVPDDVLRGSGHDPYDLRNLAEGDGDGIAEGEGFDISFWDTSRTPFSAYPRLAAMGIPLEQWWSPHHSGWPDICEVPDFMMFLKRSGCDRVVMRSDVTRWYPNTPVGRNRMSRHLVYGEVAEATSDGECVTVEVVRRTAESLYRNAYGDPPSETGSGMSRQPAGQQDPGGDVEPTCLIRIGNGLMGRLEKVSEMLGVTPEGFIGKTLDKAIWDELLLAECEESIEMLGESPTFYTLDDLKDIR